MKYLAARCAAALCVLSSFASAAPPVRANALGPAVIEIAGTKLRAHDLPFVDASAPNVDIVPAPPVGSSRTLDREELARALSAAGLARPQKLPPQIKIVRKSRRLEGAELAEIIRRAVPASKLPKGAQIMNVRAGTLEVPAGYDSVAAAVPPVPRRAGTAPVTIALTFTSADEIVARATVALDVLVPAEALVPDVAKGTSITLMVQRGLVEVSMPAVASADGDVGSVVPFLLKGSGHVVRARLIDKEHATLVGDS